MMGGAISGYCATGRRKNDTPPTMMNTMETTAAKIGRSMKKCEMRMRRSASSIRLGGRTRTLRGGRPLSLGGDLGAGACPHQAVDDDAVVGCEPFLDNPQSVDDLAKRHVLLPCRALGIDHQHVLARLLGGDRRIGHQQRLVGW